jgi:hypothetical protein
MKMKTLLLIILAFGLSSSAFAQQVGLQKSSSPVSSLLEKTSGLDFSMQSTLIAPPAAMLNSVSPKSQNTARSRLKRQPISRTTKKKTSATSAMTTGLRECKSIISRQRNTSAMMRSTYSCCSPLALLGKFITT